MPIVKDGKLVDDPFTSAVGQETIPVEGPVLVSLAQWRENRDALLTRDTGLGVELASDESPEEIADDLDRLDVVALEFPAFTDGRAYSYARLLRDKYGYQGEVRAVGDVLLEQLAYMSRVGFDAFAIRAGDALDAWKTALDDISVWYQPTGDGHQTAMQLRRRGGS